MASFFSRVLASVGNSINTYTGEDSYKFGDFSRATASRVGTAVRQYTGKDEYQFGDVSRETISKLHQFRERHQTPAIGYLRDNVLGYTNKDRYVLGDITLSTVRKFINFIRENTSSNSNLVSIESTDNAIEGSDELIEVLSRAFWLPNKHDVDIKCTQIQLKDDVIWESFFVIAYELSIQCIHLGVLVVDDFAGLEPFLFIGLPSLVLVEAVHRSIEHEGIVLATGTVVTETNCPDGVKSMFQAIDRFKKKFLELDLNTFELSWLKLNLLFTTGCDKEPPELIAKRVSPDRMVRINAIKSEVIGVSILLTQMLIFKEKFGRVMTRVLEDITESD
ncbi:hypothetical protein LOD99_11694 [Oopsacas minuta]|uniref:Uncharacterized protein n=1 Tax=Oopsacas minuta TaxID=111878 RepID=A0AAV7JKV3_9METZ|nr:hypothetical protein LOD99_11694 [Oopsacas minuta]